MPIYPSYPEVAHRAVMFHDEATVVTGGPNVTIVTATTHPHNILPFLSGGAINEEFSNSFFVKAGTYTLYVLGQTWNNRGILDWYVDGSLVLSGQDWYSVGAVVNVLKSGSLGALTDGYHVLTAKAASKNASSSAYFAVLTTYWVKQASD